MLIRETIQWIQVPFRSLSGIEQMALDEALLEWVRMGNNTSPRLVVRTYQWEKPTLSLGVHQKDRLFPTMFIEDVLTGTVDLVRRPTGGRAIFHDANDLSLAFVTNTPSVVYASLHDSYCLFNTWVRKTLAELGVALKNDCPAGNRDYLASNLCFETKTPSDLLTADGHKVFGAAQLRRGNGLLQHGSARLEFIHVARPEDFHRCLLTVMGQDLVTPPVTVIPEEEPELYDRWRALQEIFSGEVSQTCNRLSTTSGSHLVPASD